ncbi:hypothetical protein BT69DRAFT_1214322, partial [Atractiella rhizophila]
SFRNSDDTGLFAAICRHDQPLIFANIFKSGEKYRVLHMNLYLIDCLQTLLFRRGC